jgi:hypothetical protein
LPKISGKAIDRNTIKASQRRRTF